MIALTAVNLLIPQSRSLEWKEARFNVVSLWDMLTLLSGGTALGGALAAIKITGGGSVRRLIGITLGIGLGILCIVAVRMAGDRYFRHIRLQGITSNVDMNLWLMYLAATVWIAVSLFLGMQITETVIHLIT